MTVIRKAQEFFEGELSRLLKRPLAKRETYSLGDPTTPTAVGVTSAKNTAIIATYDGVGYVVCYDRQAINTWLAPTLAVMPPMAITHHNPKKTLDLFYDFDKRFQLGIKQEELVDADIDVSTGAVTFTLNDKNPWFIGSVTIPVTKVFLDEAGIIYDFDWHPPICEMTTADAVASYGITKEQYDSRIDATMLTYGVDYSAQSTALAAITPWTSFDAWTNITSANATALAAAMKAVDGVAWINGAANTNYNLANSGVIYNGPTEGFPGMSTYLTSTLGPDTFINPNYHLHDNVVNKDYARVLIAIINLGYGSINLRGAIVVHYGGKVRAWDSLPDTVPTPEHNWPLVEDGRDLGSSPAAMDTTNWEKRLWPSYEQVMALPSVNSLYPLGAALDTSGDFTLSFKVWRGSNEATATWAVFGNGDTQTSGAIFNNSGGLYYVSGTTSKWSGPQFASQVRGGGYHTITIVREGTEVYVYKDGVLGSVQTAPSFTNKSITHLGKIATYNWQPLDAIGDIMFWKQALNPKQVAKIKPNNRQLVRQ